jgi:hypothetical protein
LVSFFSAMGEYIVKLDCYFKVNFVLKCRLWRKSVISSRSRALIQITMIFAFLVLEGVTYNKNTILMSSIIFFITCPGCKICWVLILFFVRFFLVELWFREVSHLSKVFPEVNMVFGSGQKLSLSPENYLFRVILAVVILLNFFLENKISLGF